MLDSDRKEAVTSDPVLIEEMTWTEVEQALAAGKTTAVLACGAVEQHGPHLPTCTDAVLGTAIAERAARIAGTALVAPTIRPGLSEHHMHFPGSFTLRPETFVAVLTDVCESLARQGFRRVVIFPSHGGNADMMKAHTPSIARPLAGRCEVVVSLKGPAEVDRMLDVVAELGVTLGRAGVHAGYIETAMMLHAAPHLVQMQHAAPGRCDDEFYLPENVRESQMESFIQGIQTQSPNGILGDPTGATAEVGDRLLQAAAEAIAADVVGGRRAVAAAT